MAVHKLNELWMSEVFSNVSIKLLKDILLGRIKGFYIKHFLILSYSVKREDNNVEGSAENTDRLTVTFSKIY